MSRWQLDWEVVVPVSHNLNLSKGRAIMQWVACYLIRMWPLVKSLGMACNSHSLEDSCLPGLGVLPPPCPFSPPFVCCWVLWFIDDFAGFHHLTSNSYVLIYMHNTYTFFTWSCKTCNFYLGWRASQSFQNYFGDYWPIKVTHCPKNKKRVLECITTI